MITLREDQETAIERLRASVRAGKRRIMLQAATGFGKTILAGTVVRAALAKGGRVLFTVPAIQLVDQTVASLELQGVDNVGVIQAMHERTNWDMPVQVASVQSLMKRTIPEASVVIVDEAHRWFKFYGKWFLDPKWAAVPFIGLSATPWTKGLGRYYEELIVAGTTEQCIAAGTLSPFKVFAPSHPDLSGVATTGGDYQRDQLSGAMSKDALVADVVQTWLKLGENRPTLCFAVDRAHAKNLQKRFEDAGVTCGYQDAFTKADERTLIRMRFHSGEYKVVCNVGTLCLDQETEILTDTGWVGMEAMSYGHRVAAWSETGIEFTNPLHIVRRAREPHERMVSLRGRVHNIRVTSNHRMLWSKSPGNFQIRSAESIVGETGFIPVTGRGAPAVRRPITADLDREHRRGIGLRHKYRSQGMLALQAVAAEEEHREHLRVNCTALLPHELSLDHCMFVGFWIGDGCGSGGRVSVSQSCRYSKIIAWVDALIGRLGLHATKTVYPPAIKSKNESIRWNFSSGRGGRGQRVAGGVAPLLPYLEKDGSDWFWGLNVEQFGALLHGYWLADGNHGDGSGEGRGHQISGRSLKLFDLLQAIGACRGYRISIRRDNSKHRKSPFYKMCWLKQSASRLVRERFRLEEDFKLERVWCVTSTTGNIITRRRGKVAVVGNTTGVDWDVRCLILARPTKSEILFVQMIGRGLRTAPPGTPLKDHLLVLDHSDNHLRLGFVTDIHHDTLHDGKMPFTAAARDGIQLPKECPQCAYLKAPGTAVCPNCGHTVARHGMAALERAGELRELKRREKAPAGSVEAMLRETGKEAVYAGLLWLVHERGYNGHWADHKFRELFGVWPNHYKNTPPAQPSAALRSWVKHRQIAWAKGKDAAEGRQCIEAVARHDAAKQAQPPAQPALSFVSGTLCTEDDLRVDW